MKDRLGLLPLLGHRRWWLAGGLLLIFLSVAAGVMLLSLSGWFLTASALTGLGLIAALDVFTPGAGVQFAAITRTASRYMERLVTHDATFRLLADLRLRLFDRLLTLDEGQLRGLQRGDTLNRLTADVDTLDHLFLGVIGPGLSAFLLTLLAGVLTGWLIDPWLAVAAIGLLLVVNPVVAEVTRQRGRVASRSLVTTLPELRRHASDNLEALQDVVAFDLGARERRALEQRSAQAIGLQERLQKLDAVAQALVTLTGFTAVWLALVLGIGLLRADVISGPVLGLLALGVLALGEAWQALPSAWRRLEQCRGAAQRLGETMDREPLLRAADAGLPPAGQRLELRGVSFRYRDDLPPVLENVDMEIAPGERVALVGPSGAGKSTLAMLMMRQLDPDSGVVCLEGVDLRRLDQDLLRRHIGVLAQRPVLFRDTLAGNLRLAAPDATDAMLFAALETAGLADFARGLEDGPDTWIDEAASNISGGEARRIALARLVLSDCPIVILDEPTTGLDAGTARAISATLDTWLVGRTTVMITHDPELLPPHDRVVQIGTAS